MATADGSDQPNNPVMPQQKVTDKICAERVGAEAHLSDLYLVLAGLFYL